MSKSTSDSLEKNFFGHPIGLRTLLQGTYQNQTQEEEILIIQGRVQTALGPIKKTIQTKANPN